MHGNKCVNCGATEDIEWHHIVPLEIGGYDTLENMAPLCHSCHKAVTHHELLLATFGRIHDKKGGRPSVLPDNYEAILEDYTRCRISKSEAAKRLGKPSVRFNGEMFLVKYMTDNGIAKYKNNLDIYMSKHDYISVGHKAGMIEYVDGRTEELFWGVEKPLTGESSIPTKTHKEWREEQKKPHLTTPVHQLAKEAREEIHRQYISELSAAEKIAVARTNRRMSESYGIDESWWQQYKQKNKV